MISERESSDNIRELHLSNTKQEESQKVFTTKNNTGKVKISEIEER